MAMRAINVKIKFCTLSQKRSTGLHEIWHVCSNRHYGYLYSFQGLGNVNFLSSRGPKKVQLYTVYREKCNCIILKVLRDIDWHEENRAK